MQLGLRSLFMTKHEALQELADSLEHARQLQASQKKHVGRH